MFHSPVIIICKVQILCQDCVQGACQDFEGSMGIFPGGLGILETLAEKTVHCGLILAQKGPNRSQTFLIDFVPNNARLRLKSICHCQDLRRETNFCDGFHLICEFFWGGAVEAKCPFAISVDRPPPQLEHGTRGPDTDKRPCFVPPFPLLLSSYATDEAFS